MLIHSGAALLIALSLSVSQLGRRRRIHHPAGIAHQDFLRIADLTSTARNPSSVPVKPNRRTCPRPPWALTRMGAWPLEPQWRVAALRYDLIIVLPTFGSRSVLRSEKSSSSAMVSGSANRIPSHERSLRRRDLRGGDRVPSERPAIDQNRLHRGTRKQVRADRQGHGRPTCDDAPSAFAGLAIGRGQQSDAQATIPFAIAF